MSIPLFNCNVGTLLTMPVFPHGPHATRLGGRRLMDAVIFTTQRLRAVPWRSDHADAAFAAYSRPEMVQHLGNATPHPDVEHTRAGIERIRAGYDANGFDRGFWALELLATGDVVGATICSSLAVARRLGMEHLGRTTRYYDGFEAELFRSSAGTARAARRR
jgi:hypothetical protein